MRTSAALAIGFTPPLLDTLRALDGACDVIAADEVGSALSLLRERSFQAIFVHAHTPGFSPNSFDQLRIAAPSTPKALVGASTDVPDLETLAGYGEFSFLDVDQSELAFAATAHALLFPRTLQRVQFAGCCVTGWLGEQTFEHPLLDLSNGGLAFGVRPGEPVAGLRPGEAVRDIRILDSDGRPLFGPMQGTIRHCKADETVLGPVIHIGVSLDKPTPARAPHVRVLSEPLPIVSSLRKAAGGGASFTLALPDAEGGFRFSDGEVGAGPPLHLALPGPCPADLQLHDVVRLNFSHMGKSYSGLTSIIEIGDRIRVAIPRTLRVHHRRGSNRHKPRPGREYSVDVHSPLSGLTRAYTVHDINATGFSVIIDKNVDILPPGLVLDPVVIHLPDGSESITVRGVVRSLAPIARRADDGDATPARCGIEILQCSRGSLERLSEHLLADGFPHIEAAVAEDFEAIWSFLREAGFVAHLYADPTPEKRAIVDAGLARLLSAGRSVSVALVFRDKGTIHGHLNAIQMYSNTLLATHLAASQTQATTPERISRALCLGSIEYAEQHPNIEFFKLIWNRDLPWPNRMFGWSGRGAEQQGLSQGREFGVLIRPNDAALPAAVDGVRVDDPSETELKRIESYFVESFGLVRIQSEDLPLAELSLHRIGAEYKRCGFRRERRARVARVDGEMVAFSLIEITTQGLQLSELTNGFDVYTLPEAPQYAQERARSALAGDAVRIYTKEGMLHSVALSENPDYSPFLEIGFQHVVTARSWTWHRSLLRSWTDALDTIFVNGRQLFGGKPRKE